MQKDEDVGKVAQATPILICEDTHHLIRQHVVTFCSQSVGTLYG